MQLLQPQHMKSIDNDVKLPFQDSKIERIIPQGE